MTSTQTQLLIDVLELQLDPADISYTLRKDMVASLRSSQLPEKNPEKK